MKNTIKRLNQSYSTKHMCSFVLRLWQVEPIGSTTWRASIENPETGKRVGFASLEQLFAFLIDFTESNCDQGSLEGR